jgi:major membrane immunogen (membrane-anchored lipoprotein)
MAKKRIIAVIATAVLSISLFAGCGAQATYKDGTYKAEYSAADSRGWKPQLSLVIKEDKITEVTFDYVNEAGALKTADEAYKTAMEAKTGTYPAKYTEDLEKALIEKQKVEDVAAVTGATSSSANFNALAAAALEKAKAGDTATAIVEMKAE